VVDPVRVLVVDDSAFVRSMIVRVLEAEPAIRVVGTAANGFTAMDLVNTASPDVITLDIEMPGMDGREFLKRLRMTHPRLPVIMFSHLTQRGAVTTVDMLFLGATDYVGKPSYTGSAEAAREQIKAQLVPKILALKARRSEPPRSAKDTSGGARDAVARDTAGFRDNATARDTGGTAAPVRRAAPQKTTPVEIVAIGSSTGGPVALDEILSSLPRDFSVPVVVVQHMPSTFIQLLAERMSARSRVPVTVAKSGDIVTPRKVLLAPGEQHMVVRRHGTVVVVELTNDAPVNGCRPAVDILFKSVGKVYGSAALGVVLTGMGSDGLEGSRAIVDAGGRVLVQDEVSSVVWGMPGQVAKAGLAQAVLSIKELSLEIANRGRNSTRTHAPGG
jgi:two-component system chemotaxis response regulator CheB